MWDKTALPLGQLTCHGLTCDLDPGAVGRLLPVPTDIQETQVSPSLARVPRHAPGLRACSPCRAPPKPPLVPARRAPGLGSLSRFPRGRGAVGDTHWSAAACTVWGPSAFPKALSLSGPPPARTPITASLPQVSRSRRVGNTVSARGVSPSGLGPTGSALRPRGEEEGGLWGVTRLRPAASGQRCPGLRPLTKALSFQVILCLHIIQTRKREGRG